MTNNIKTSMGVFEWSLLIVLSILWGGSFFFNGVAVSSLPPLIIVALRVCLAAVVLWVIAFALGLNLPRSLDIWLAFLVMGLLNNVVPFFLIAWGQTQIASGLASILNASTPFFTVVVASILLSDERVTSKKLFGVVTGFIGVAIMIGYPAFHSSNNLLAQVAIIGAALSYAFAGVYGRRFKAMGVKPLVTAAGQVTASTLVILPVALIVEGADSLSTPSVKVWSSIVGLAVLSTAFAYVIYFKILETAGATNLLLVTLLIPVSAILLGNVFLGEVLGTIHYLGMAIIALGLSVIDGRIWKRNFLKRATVR